MDDSLSYLPELSLESVQEADALLTRDLFRLSFQDRNNIVEEVHGVRNLAIDETPLRVANSLRDLSNEIENVSSKSAYEKCQELFPNETYVNTDEFRLKFLRFEFFDAQKAAVRMLAYLDLVHELYNTNEVLCRPVHLSDLTKAEVKLMRLGYYQLLPYRDRSGRPIFANVGTLGFTHALRSRVRVFFYLWSVASEDVESQRKGMVHVAWPEGDFSQIPMPLHSESRKLLKKVFAAMPIRVAGMHLCFPDNVYFNLLRSFILLVFDTERSRMMMHTSAGIERRYKLHSFGIPADIIPITDSGNIKKVNLYQWIRVRKLIESKGSDSVISLPRSNDVLIRSGTTTISHPGNAFFRGLIETKHREFRSGSNLTQALMAEAIVDTIDELSGRFLIWNSIGFWTEIEDRQLVIFKVEVAIRDFKAKIRAHENRQNEQSSTRDFVGESGDKMKRRRIEHCRVQPKSTGDCDVDLDRCTFQC